jgi:thiol-disulfide isomerase/thioredoxin
MAQDSKTAIIGTISRSALFADKELSLWFITGYTNYKPNDSIIAIINTRQLNGSSLKVAVIFGSWCGDSKKEVPRLVKVLDVIGVDTANVNFIGVDRKKKSPRRDILHYKISRVPTVVITYTLGEKIIQMGRITEHPKLSFEDEILKIIDSHKP